MTASPTFASSPGSDWIDYPLQRKFRPLGTPEPVSVAAKKALLRKVEDLQFYQRVDLSDLPDFAPLSQAHLARLYFHQGIGEIAVLSGLAELPCTAGVLMLKLDAWAWPGTEVLAAFKNLLVVELNFKPPLTLAAPVRFALTTPPQGLRQFTLKAPAEIAELDLTGQGPINELEISVYPPSSGQATPRLTLPKGLKSLALDRVPLHTIINLSDLPARLKLSRDTVLGPAPHPAAESVRIISLTPSQLAADRIAVVFPRLETLELTGYAPHSLASLLPSLPSLKSLHIPDADLALSAWIEQVAATSPAFALTADRKLGDSPGFIYERFAGGRWNRQSER